MFKMIDFYATDIETIKKIRKIIDKKEFEIKGYNMDVRNPIGIVLWRERALKALASAEKINPHPALGLIKNRCYWLRKIGDEEVESLLFDWWDFGIVSIDDTGKNKKYKLLVSDLTPYL